MDIMIYKYLTEDLNIPQEEAINIAELFEKNEEIESEFAWYAAVKDFPPHDSGISIHDYTAEKIYKKYNVVPAGAYIYLLGLSKNFKEVIKILNKTEKRRISPPISAVVGFNGPYLIIKGDFYYIRFDNNGRIYDLLINEDKVKRLINREVDIEELLSGELSNKRYTSEHFINSELKYYLDFWCDLSDEEINNLLYKFRFHEDLKNEFYDTLMTSKFPSDPISELGYTAEDIFYKKDYYLWESYVSLIFLQESPKEALCSLEEADNE